jgi:hypothetical protein
MDHRCNTSMIQYQMYHEQHIPLRLGRQVLQSKVWENVLPSLLFRVSESGFDFMSKRLMR